MVEVPLGLNPQDRAAVAVHLLLAQMELLQHPVQEVLAQRQQLAVLL